MVCPVPWENFYCGIVFSCLQRSSEPRPPETWSPCRLAWAMSGQQSPGRPLWSPLTFPEAVGWPGKAGRPGLEVWGIHVLLDLRLMLFGIFFKKKNTERSFFCNFFYFYFFLVCFFFLYLLISSVTSTQTLVNRHVLGPFPGLLKELKIELHLFVVTCPDSSMRGRIKEGVACSRSLVSLSFILRSKKMWKNGLHLEEWCLNWL